MAQSKQGFENRLEKLLRLLDKLNQECAGEFIGENDALCLALYADGSGSIAHVGSEEPLYQFDTTDQLFEYLEAKPLKRLLLAKQN